MAQPVSLLSLSPSQVYSCLLIHSFLPPTTPLSIFSPAVIPPFSRSYGYIHFSSSWFYFKSFFFFFFFFLLQYSCFSPSNGHVTSSNLTCPTSLYDVPLTHTLNLTSPQTLSLSRTTNHRQPLTPHHLVYFQHSQHSLTCPTG